MKNLSSFSNGLLRYYNFCSRPGLGDFPVDKKYFGIYLSFSSDVLYELLSSLHIILHPFLLFMVLKVTPTYCRSMILSLIYLFILFIFPFFSFFFFFRNKEENFAKFNTKSLSLRSVSLVVGLIFIYTI